MGYNCCVESELGKWIRDQYGAGHFYKTARQLSLAISDGRNPNQVFDIEARGTAKIETVCKIAAALGMPVLDVFVAAGWIPKAELEAKTGRVLTANQEKAAGLIETLPDAFAGAWLESGERLLELAEASRPEPQVGEGSPESQASPESR